MSSSNAVQPENRFSRFLHQIKFWNRDEERWKERVLRKLVGLDSFLKQRIAEAIESEGVLRLNNLNITNLTPVVWELANLNYLHLAHNKIGSLPQQIGELKNLTYLNLEFNCLKSLPPQIGGLRNLKNLSVSHNLLEYLPPELIACPDLEVFHFSHNPNLMEIPLWLGQLRKLYQLGVEKIGLRAEKGKSFVNALLHVDGSLRSQLNCWKTAAESPCDLNVIDQLSTHKKNALQTWLNRLESARECARSQTKLARAVCGQLNKICGDESFFNRMRDFSLFFPSENPEDSCEVLETKFVDLERWNECAKEAVTDAVNQKILNLEFWDISSLPTFIGKLTSLEMVRVHNCEIRYIPPEIRNLPLLKKVCLSFCQLETVPPVIWHLTTLEKLDLSGNLINALPPAIGKLTHLRKLNVSGNMLESLPEEIGKLSALQYLDLSFNQLTKLPTSLRRLKELDISKNPLLREIPFVLGEVSRLVCDGLDPEIRRVWQLQDSLQKRVEGWKIAAKSNVDLTKVSSFTDGQKNRLNSWLERLENCPVFSRSQVNAGPMVCALLKSVCEEQKFQEFFFNHYEMPLEEIYLYWKAPENALSCAKTLALRHEISKQLGFESAAISLHYESLLKDFLDLCTASDYTLLESIEHWINLEVLIKSVNRHHHTFVEKLKAYTPCAK